MRLFITNGFILYLVEENRVVAEGVLYLCLASILSLIDW